jgi:hypothetical protein
MSNNQSILLFALLFVTPQLLAQTFTGNIINKSTRFPVAYVNIGVLGKNLGTVGNDQGKFTLNINSTYEKDTLLFSCIGYAPVSIKISDLLSGNQLVEMQETHYELDEVVVKPVQFTEKTLGITSTAKYLQAGFSENKLGYELGVLIKNKKSAFIKWICINIAKCTYDTIFYRLNVYTDNGDHEFENILKQPIYINIPKLQIQETVYIDLSLKNIVTPGNFLITLEHVKDLGEGELMFCCALGKRTYYRKTSQDLWTSEGAAGVSISVIADVEK